MSNQVISDQSKNEIISRRQGTKLLAALINNPSLPSLVKRLEPNALNKLIARIGLEDSADIISLATFDQIKQVLDSELWKNFKPGKEEAFDVRGFVNWLSVCLEIDDAFVASMLVELGEDTVGWCLSSLMTVVDTQSMGFTAENGEGLYFERYMILPKEDECWFDVVAALNALWREDPDYLLCLLRGCCVSSSVLSSVDTECCHFEQVHCDNQYTRERRRQRKGFVTPLNASQFLDQSRKSSLDVLLGCSGYDMNTQQYFDAAKKMISSNNLGLAPSGELDCMVAEIESLLLDEDVNNGGQSAPLSEKLLLESDSHNGMAEDDCILRSILIELLMADNEQCSILTKEIVYLSNVLISGIEMQEQRFSEFQSGEAVLATANLGVEFVATHRYGSSPNKDQYTQYVMEHGGLINAFKIGFHLISNLPVQCINRVSGVLKSSALKNNQKHTRWIREEIEMGWKGDRLIEQIERQSFVEVKEQIDFLSLVMDNETCIVLKALVDSYPCFPSLLENKANHSVHAKTSSRFIQSMDDLFLIGGFFEMLNLSI